MAAVDNIARGMAGRVAKTKVDKVPGKGLSTNDFTDADKQKIDAITNPMQIVGRVDTVADLDNITPTPAAGSIYLVGLESDPDKEEYVYTEEGTWEYLGAHIPVDTELSTTSTNPVQNRIVTAAVNEKLKAIAAAAAYDPSHTYVAGEYMTLDGELYKYDANGSAIPVGEDLLKTYASRLKDSTYGYRDNTSWSSSYGGTLRYNVSNFYITGTIPVTSGKTYRINSSAYTKWSGNEYSGAIFTNSSTANTVQKWVQYSTDGSASVVTTESNAPYLSISIFKANEAQYSVYELSAQKFTKTTITDELRNSVSGKADITLIAAEYDNTATYTKGAYTVHDGKYFKANTDISTAEAWNSSHWDEVTVGGELKNITDNEVGQFYPYNENGTIYIGEIFNDYTNNETRARYAHAEGQNTKATGHCGHAEGYKTTAHYHSHAEGDNTTATGDDTHAEGTYTNATGNYAHAEGYYSTASGDASHSEGSNTTASGADAHAEGNHTTASSPTAHAEGSYTTASAQNAHAEGASTTANGINSHAQNLGTIAKGTSQTALGKFNIEDNNNAYAVIIGNGTSDDARNNAVTIEWNGTTRIAGNKVITTADFDTTPTAGSTNPVTSGGIKAAFDEKVNYTDMPIVSNAEYENIGTEKYTDNKAYFVYDGYDNGADVKIYGFHIDPNESDPKDCVTYLEDAVGMTPAAMGATTFDYGSWKNAFFMPRPCMVKSNGKVDYYLNPNDYTKKLDGTASDIADASYDGNAMMEWPLIWWKYEAGEADGEGYFYCSNVKVDNTYDCYCNVNCDDQIVEHFYTAIYNGTGTSKLRSISGVTLTSANGNGGTTYTQESDRAMANNTTTKTEWFIDVWADRMLINGLLILMGKSLNTQAVFGRGLDTGSQTAKEAYVTGTLNDKGLFWGDISTGTSGVKVFGMENWYSCVWHRTAGLIGVANNAYAYKMTYGTYDGTTAVGYNTTAVGYKTTAANIRPATNYFNKAIWGQFGYLPFITSSSSSTTYFSDYYYNGTGFALVGGGSNSGANGGASYFGLNSGAGSASWSIAASLTLKPLA